MEKRFLATNACENDFVVREDATHEVVGLADFYKKRPETDKMMSDLALLYEHDGSVSSFSFLPVSGDGRLVGFLFPGIIGRLR